MVEGFCVNQCPCQNAGGLPGHCVWPSNPLPWLYPLAKIKGAGIQGYYADALKSGRKEGKGGLAASTVIHHHRVLFEALSHAVKWELIASNPL